MIVDDARHSSMKVTKLSNQLSHGCPRCSNHLRFNTKCFETSYSKSGCPKLSLQHPSPPNRTILPAYPVFIRLTGYPLGYYLFMTKVNGFRVRAATVKWQSSVDPHIMSINLVVAFYAYSCCFIFH